MPATIKGGGFRFGDQVIAEDGSFDNFFSWLEDNNDKQQWPYYKDFEQEKITIERRLICHSNDKYWYGVILSARNTDIKYILDRTNGIVKPQNIRPEDRNFEINFFCLRRDTHKGIYSHYQGSYPFSRFIPDIWGTYKSFIKKKKDPFINILESTLKGKQLKNAKKELNYQFNLRNISGPIYTPEGFKQLVDKINRLEEVAFTTYVSSNKADEPISKQFKSKRAIYRFDKQIPIAAEQRKWINGLRELSIKLLNKGSRYNGKIAGYGSGDEYILIDFDKTLEECLNYDYTELGEFELDKLFEHAIINLMVRVLKNNAIFEETED